MKFDAIVGNPPYQLADGGYGASAIALYPEFVELAKLLAPRYLSMVIPSRWLFGGRGLSAFRKAMLNDRRIRKLVDGFDSRAIFEHVDVAGGICYFVWHRDEEGECKVVEYDHSMNCSQAVRPLLENGLDVFIRSNRALSILKKIVAVDCPRGQSANSISLPAHLRFDQGVSAQKPFGLRTFFRGTVDQKSQQDVLVIQSGGSGWTSRSAITQASELVDKWKVFTGKSSNEHAGQVDKKGQRRVLSRTGVIPPGSVVTESYIVLGAFDTREEALNCLSYVCTQFFRFLLVTRSSGQDLARSAYGLVPIQDFTEAWTDQKLIQKYGLNSVEVQFIGQMIRPMGEVEVIQNFGQIFRLK